MADVPTNVAVSLLCEFIGLYSPVTMSGPGESAGDIIQKIRNAVGGESWTYGTGSGKVNQIHVDEVSVGSGATKNYNTLAAGAHLDVFGNTIDLDELKGLIIVPLTGSIRIDAPAANILAIFSDATDVINLASAGVFCMTWGAAGIDVTTNSTFDITETTSAAVATYLIAFWGTS